MSVSVTVMNRRIAIQSWSVVVAGFVLSLLSGILTPASAAALEYNETTQVGVFDTSRFNVGWDAGYGQIGFDPNGDEIWVWDRDEDGASVGARWETTDGRKGLCRNKSGSSGRWGKCNKNFSESASIRIWIGKCNANATRTCKVLSDWSWSTAGWSRWAPVG